MTMASKTNGLSIAVQSGAVLGPEQRKYNQLVAKIGKARAELLAWQEQLPLFAQAEAERKARRNEQAQARCPARCTPTAPATRPTACAARR
jgi:hypothetical protein